MLYEGVVAERGTHAQLLTANGIYADMWRKQSQSESDADMDADSVGLEDDVEVAAGPVRTAGSNSAK